MTPHETLSALPTRSAGATNNPFTTHSRFALRAAVWPLALLVVVAGLVRLRLAWLPLSVLLRWVPDDAFYYFVIARNMGAGLGSTFDGVVPTNGYHPVWLLFLLPIFKGQALVGDASTNLPIHLALSLGALLDMATIWLCFRIARQVTASQRLALLAAGLYAFNPFVLSQAINGLETALNNLLLAGATLAFLYLAEPGNEAKPRQVVGAGALLGAAFLTRTDNVIFVALLLLGYTVACKSRAGLARAILMGLTSAIIATPWLLWNWRTFGAWVQSSGVAVPYRNHAMFEGAPLAERIAHTLDWGRFALDAAGSSTGFGFVAATILTVALVAWAFAARRSRPEAKSAMWPLYLLVVSIMVTLSVHTAIRWSTRVWYFAPVGLVSALLLGAILPSKLPICQRNLAAPLIGLLGLLAFTFSLPPLYSQGHYPWQAELMATANWLRENTIPETRVGAFNAGIVGYYSERPVTNLDGVVDDGALRALQRRDMAGYIMYRSLQVVADNQYFFDDEGYGRFLGADFDSITRPVATLPSTFAGERPIIIFAVEPPP